MKKFFAVFIMSLSLVFGTTAIAIAATATNASSQSPNWITEAGISKFKSNITSDIEYVENSFENKQLVKDYVPIEAKVGLAFMNAMSLVGEVLDNSLVRFVIIFLIIAYGFWIFFDTYNAMKSGKNMMDLAEIFVKKVIVLAIWIMVLNFGAGKIFMWIMGPIVTVGTYMSDLILNAVSMSAGVTIPDTCSAIHEYTAAHTSARMLLDADVAADIMCVPTRLSGFFTTMIAAGFKWMIAGIGRSIFTFLMGAVSIYVFIRCAFKFAFIALGVIADLFLSVLMLPFTAIAETIPKTSYKGIAGDIFNGFMGLFETESLDTQIQRFVNAAIYFVSLSIVVALCGALLSGVIDADITSEIPSLENSGAFVTLLTGILVMYLANKADKIAGDLGGKSSSSNEIGNKLKSDIQGLWKSATGTVTNVWKTVRGKK